MENTEKYCLRCKEKVSNQDHPERENYCSNCGQKLILAGEKDYQKWLVIATTLKCIRFQIFNDLLPNLRNVPKSVYNKQLDKLLKSFDQMKSDLEDRFSKECPEQFDTHVFYGADKQRNQLNVLA